MSAKKVKVEGEGEETVTVSRNRYEKMMSLIQAVSILGCGMKINQEMEDLAREIVNTEISEDRGLAYSTLQKASSLEHVARFGGRDRVTFQRVQKRTTKSNKE